MSANLQATPKVVPIRLVPSAMFDMPGVLFTPTGLVIKPGLDIHQWVELGRKLRRGVDSLRIWVGDYIRYGKHEYGKKYAAALALTGYKEKTLRNSVWIANKVPLSLRRDKLKFQHYANVAALPKGEVKVWLNLADEKNWTASRMKREIRNATGKAPKIPRAMQAMKQTAVREELDEKISELRRWLETPCDAVLTILYQRTIKAFEWQRDRTVESDCEAIVKVFNGELGTEAPEIASDGDISAWLHGHSFIMDEQEVDERLELMCRLKILIKEDRERSRHAGQKGAITPVYRAEQDYFSALQELDLLPAAERAAKLRRDWNDRLDRYAPELKKSLGNFEK